MRKRERVRSARRAIRALLTNAERAEVATLVLEAIKSTSIFGGGEVVACVKTAAVWSREMERLTRKRKDSP